MAQRKSPSGRPPAKSPAVSVRKPTGPSAANRPSGARPPAKKPGKSIVNQKQTPWGLIWTTVAVVVFAAIVVGAVVITHKDDSDTQAFCTGGDKCYSQPEVGAAKKISGVQYHVEADHMHVSGTVDYDRSPPIGGNHSSYWADCTGVVYDHQIANENAVHMLEHGAVWITYNPKTATKSDINTLSALVTGVDHMALSPYADLKTPISLQAWNYQLFVQKATDPRVEQFINALRYNPGVVPEPGASCSDPQFQADQSTPGHPFEG